LAKGAPVESEFGVMIPYIHLHGMISKQQKILINYRKVIETIRNSQS